MLPRCFTGDEAFVFGDPALDDGAAPSVPEGIATFSNSRL